MYHSGLPSHWEILLLPTLNFRTDKAGYYAVAPSNAHEVIWVYHLLMRRTRRGLVWALFTTLNHITEVLALETVELGSLGLNSDKKA
jgi:hypothetical protein